MALLLYEVYIDVILSRFYVVLAGTFKVEGIFLDDLLGGNVERGWGSNINKPWSMEPYILVGK